MAFYSGSDEMILRVVERAGTGLLVLALLVLIIVLVLRARLLAREKRRQRFLTVWQPILLNSVSVATSDVPSLERRDLSTFLVIWNHLQESLLDKSKDHLNQIAKALRIGKVALLMLRHRNARDRLMAIITLGHLRERAAWDALVEIIWKEKAVLSVAAARALAMIDAEKAVPLLMPLLAGRTDWPAPRVATILQTAGAETISAEITRAIVEYSLVPLPENPDSKAPLVNPSTRLIRYLELAYNISAIPTAQIIVRSSHDPETLAAGLRFLRSSEDLEIVRNFLTHRDWRVRVQASSALGRIGENEDKNLLIPLISDKEWWVRYRAAQALSRLPSICLSELEAIQAEQSDRFARDMLAQVAAEIGLQ